jgi:hypothetical protein
VIVGFVISIIQTEAKEKPGSVHQPDKTEKTKTKPAAKSGSQALSCRLNYFFGVIASYPSYICLGNTCDHSGNSLWIFAKGKGMLNYLVHWTNSSFSGWMANDKIQLSSESHHLLLRDQSRTNKLEHWTHSLILISEHRKEKDGFENFHNRPHSFGCHVPLIIFRLEGIVQRIINSALEWLLFGYSNSAFLAFIENHLSADLFECRGFHDR